LGTFVFKNRFGNSPFQAGSLVFLPPDMVRGGIALRVTYASIAPPKSWDKECEGNCSQDNAKFIEHCIRRFSLLISAFARSSKRFYAISADRVSPRFTVGLEFCQMIHIPLDGLST